MVSLTIDKKRWLRDLGVGDTPELLERVAQFGVEVDESTPERLIVDITPNRPDLLSHDGFTRALSAFLDRDPGLKLYPTQPSKLKVTVDESLKGIRPATACAIASGLQLDDGRLQEIIDIQERLHVTFGRRRKRCAIGVYPIDAISGNITFTAKKPEEIRFRPLESEREMTAREILTEHPKGKEFAHLLEGLPAYPVFLDARGNVLSMPPVINSHGVGKVTTSTTEVFIEASGHDMRACEEVVRIICCALADMGATIKTVTVQYGKKQVVTPDLSPRKQEFYGYYVEKRLGVRIRPEQYPTLLAKMGLGHEQGRVKDTHRAIIPPYRVDFLHQVDVIEDLAIALGYEHIPATAPSLVTIARESPMSRLLQVIRARLVGHGLVEAKNYHIANKEFQARLGDADVVTLASSVSLEHDSLRASLITSLLGTLAINKVHAYPQGFFEIGTAFAPAQRCVTESTRLAVALAADTGADYTRARQVIESALAALGLSGAFAPHDDARFLRGRCARVTVGGREVGLVGELSPAAITAAGLAVPVAAAEIDIDVILGLLQK